MSKLLIKILIIFLFTINQSLTEENIMILKLKDGDVKDRIIFRYSTQSCQKNKRIG